jgi:outer membrane biosynthesis protein TonB
MKAEDVLDLIRAGYTKADIDALGIVLEKPEEKKPEEPKPEEKKPEEPKPEKKEEPKPEDKVTALETKIDYLVNRLNLLAVQTSKQKDEPTETVDDILASMVRGNKKEE